MAEAGRGAQEPGAIPRPTVIVDCDPGHDDLFALAVAADRTQLLGITTVGGNVPVESCTRNALLAVEAMGLHVEVHPGNAGPRDQTAREGTRPHGAGGLGRAEVPEPGGRPSETGALEFLVETTRQTEGVWLVATGPHTNIAAAMRADPRLPQRIAGIAMMGGGIRAARTTPAAEFNMWHDPVAAAMVFSSGAALRMVPLDATLHVRVRPTHIEQVEALGSQLAVLLARALRDYAGHWKEQTGEDSAPLHDPCALVALLRPDLFRFRHLAVEVETEGQATSGMTVADLRPLRPELKAPPNAHVAMEADGPAVLDLILETARRVLSGRR